MPNDIQSIPEAGEKLDILIDEVVFNRTFKSFPMGMCYYSDRGGWCRSEPYSTRWEGMKLVVEEMERRGYLFEFRALTSGSGIFYEVVYTKLEPDRIHCTGWRYKSRAKNLPAANAEAAVKACRDIRGGEQE